MSEVILLNDQDDDFSFDYGRDDYQTEGQQIAILSAQTFSSVLSLFGSISIIFIMLHNPAQKWKKREGVFYRLIMGVSVSDILVSTGGLISPYLEPPDPHRLAAGGTTGSCSFAGYLVYVTNSTALYNFSLSFFYYQTVVKGVRPDAFSKKWEHWIHLISIGIMLIMNAVTLGFNGFNPATSLRICAIQYYPTNCNLSSEIEPCTRGFYTKELYFVNLLVVSIPSVMGVFLTILLYLHVVRILAANRKHRFAPATDPVPRGEGPQQTEEDFRERQRKKEVAKQAVLYCAAFLNTFLWPLVFDIYEHVVGGNVRGTLGRPSPFALNLIMSFSFLLQGFFNFLVYIRPRFVTIRKQNPDKSRFYAFRLLYAKENQS